MTKKTLLLSIHQVYADAILDGTKTYELRRIRPKVGPGDCVLLYVTSPVSAICGYFEIDEVLTGSPTQIWHQVQGAAGMTRRQVYDYLTGSREPCALRVRSVHRLIDPMKIAVIRQKWETFKPPQSYRYVPGETVQRLGLNGNAR